MHITSEFGDRVRSQRQLRNLSQRDLAARTEGVISQATIQRLEAGTATPSLEYVLALAWALGVPAEELTEEQPLSQRFQLAARGEDGTDVLEAAQKLLPFLQLRNTLDSLNDSSEKPF